MQPEECPSWAPGLDIPDGECVHCHVQRRDHDRHARSGASGSVGSISSKEYALADSAISDHPEVVSPASSSLKTPPNVVFCRACNQGMVISGRPEDDYPCPACQSIGPKSLTPTGAPRGAEVRKPVHQKTPKQIAFEDGLAGAEVRSPNDPNYMEWYAEGKRRAEANSDAGNGARVEDQESILDAETEDPPPVAHEKVTYSDGSTATGPTPVPRVTPDGARAVKVESMEDLQKQPGDPDASNPAAEAK